MKTIRSFDDFVQDLREAGFSMGGERDGGVFALASFFGPEIRWHTEDAQTDPWEWRIRVLREYQDLAMGNFFSETAVTSQGNGSRVSMRHAARCRWRIRKVNSYDFGNKSVGGGI